MFKKIFAKMKEDRKKAQCKMTDDCPMCKIDPAVIEQLEQTEDTKDDKSKEQNKNCCG